MDLHYKAHPDFDLVAKFHGDRPRELGDLVAKIIKKENICSKTRPSELIPGGLIMQQTGRQANTPISEHSMFFSLCHNGGLE